MLARTLRNGVMISASALLLAACTTSKPVPVDRSGLRGVVGTSLIGTKGATATDQTNIDETVAGLCGGGVWTKSECARHGRLSRL